MAYGILKCDTITFTDAGVDKSVTISGLVQNPTFSGNITVTGTVSGNTIQGQTVSGATITGGAAAFTTVTGGVATITSGVFALGTNALPSLTFAGDLNTGIYSPGADQVAISTSGTQRIEIQADGDVNIDSGTVFIDAGSNRLGVNTSSPAYELEVSSTGEADIQIDSGSGQDAALRFAENGTNAFTIFHDASASALAVYDNTVLSQRLTIDSSGNVGIGTSSPGGPLDLAFTNATVYSGTTAATNAYAAINSSATTGSFASISLNSRNTANAGCTVNLVGISTSTNNASDFAIQQRTTSGAYRENLRITHAGNVGIGTASPGALIHGKQDVDGISNVLDLENGASSLAPEAVIRLGRPGTSNRRVAIRAIGGSNFTNPKLAFDANESERVRIDDSGRLLVGTSSARGGFDNNSGVSSNLQVEGAGTAAGGTRTALSIVNNGSADADSAGLYLARSGGTAVGSFTAVTADDALGRITFSGADGTEFVTGASIEAVVDGTPGANDLPSRLVFSTTADGASSPTERMRITSTGQVSIASGVAIIDTATSNAPYLALASSPTNATGAEVRMGARVSSSSTSAGIKAIHPDGADPDFVSIGIYVRNSGTSTDPALEIARADYQGSFRPGADNARPLGNASFRWSEVFAGTGTINTSDETLKEDIQDLEQAELTVAAEIKSLIKRFRFKDAVASKGDDARIHVGVIAQEVEQAFVNNGLDPRRYALFCEDTLEDGSKRLGIRYDELLAFVIAAL